MTFAHDIVFTEEMLESAVDDTVEDFSDIYVETDSTVIIGVKVVSTLLDWDDQTLVPNIGEDPIADDEIQEFKNSPFEFVVCIFNTIGLFGLEGLYIVL